MTPHELRLSIRRGEFDSYTAGLCHGYVQANVCILPVEFGREFLLYCNRNRSACPVIDTSDPGDYRLPRLGLDIDIRSDVPRYQIFENGELREEMSDIRKLWTKDFMAVALGCSFSFEEAILDAGIPLEYLDSGNVAGVYESSIDTNPTKILSGKLLVTMRPFNARDAVRAIQITSRFPAVHGAPLHIGNPAEIGVDLRNRYQEIGSSHVPDGMIPLFWACGLTPQLAIRKAKIPLMITHAPSKMLVTDLRTSDLMAF